MQEVVTEEDYWARWRKHDGQLGHYTLQDSEEFKSPGLNGLFNGTGDDFAVEVYSLDADDMPRGPSLIRCTLFPRSEYRMGPRLFPYHAVLVRARRVAHYYGEDPEPPVLTSRMDFVCTCPQCGGTGVGVTSDFDWHPDDGVWGGVSLRCTSCGYEKEIWDAGSSR